MEKITSFKVNHLDLLVGLYVSRIDNVNNNKVTTFDLRYTRPNIDEVMDTASLHAIEHLGATYLRNQEFQNEIIYFGPMGCRTGFYLIVAGEKTSKDVYNIVKEMNEFIINYQGLIPGASPKDCGNYTDLSLEGAKKFANKYLKEFLNNPKEEQFVYPN